ncbi:MAG TPA: hypothetical protein VLS89_03690, partial [Candidatus Nanopelagicales bacterium]|nr:hypothetical protein [Candidatus Nanopelagicales bacterium]
MHISRTVRFDKWLGLAAILAMAALPACDGPKGADGANGTNGADGTDGNSGTDGTNGADGSSTVVDQSLAPIEKAFAGVGGVDALNALTTLQVDSEGARWLFGEG